MDLLAQIYFVVDGILIAPFRLFGAPLAGFVFGVAVLAFLSIIMGEFTMAWAYLFNQRHYKEQTQEMVRMHNLSIEAIRAKDKESYKATNKWANEHFGKSFFARMALFACSMWPVPFALGWLDTRFGGMGIIELPYMTWQPGYAFFYIGLYILLRVAFAKLAKPRIPFFNRVVDLMQHEADEDIKSWGELNDAPEKTEEGAVEEEATEAGTAAMEGTAETEGKAEAEETAKLGSQPDDARQATPTSDAPSSREVGKA